MKIVKTSRILKLLAKDGWYIVHQVGSHRQFRHPTKKGKVTVNGKPSDDTWETMTGINQRQLGHYICGRSKPRKPQSEKIINALHALGKELQAITT